MTSSSRAALDDRSTPNVVLLVDVSEAETKNQPTAGQLVQDGNIRGKAHRVRGGESQPARADSAGTRRPTVVFAHRERIETSLVGNPRERVGLAISGIAGGPLAGIQTDADLE